MYIYLYLHIICLLIYKIYEFIIYIWDILSQPVIPCSPELFELYRVNKSLKFLFFYLVFDAEWHSIH